MTVIRPRVSEATEYGENPGSFWVEYPDGTIDLSRTRHLSDVHPSEDTTDIAGIINDNDNERESTQTNGVNGEDERKLKGVRMPHVLPDTQLSIEVDTDMSIRVQKKATALVVVDMQNFFLHPDLRDHPTGLDCVLPLMRVIPELRQHGVKIIWLNWGLTEAELKTLPPSLVRSFVNLKRGRRGLGTELPEPFGRLLMRGEFNSELYGPLQTEYHRGKEEGTDVWIHKNRISGLWGYQTALDLYLKENGIHTLLFAGVNADQCVLGTLSDAYHRGYDCIMLKDAVATTSPEGGLANVLYNTTKGYGFVTDTERLLTACEYE